MAALDLTTANFEAEVLNSDVPVLVDFWAKWCGPCRAIAPMISELATQYEGKVKVAKVDVDSAQELAIKYDVSSIPALMIFKGGQVVQRWVGNPGKPRLIQALDAEAAG